MKKLLLITFTLVALLGCETEPIDPAILDNLTQQSFQVNVDGELFTSSDATAVISNGQIAIFAGSDTSDATISINVASTQTGSFTNEVFATYAPTNDVAFVFTNIEQTPNGPQPNGVFKILSINQNTQMISGTFEFIAHSNDVDNPGDEFQPKSLTSGVFNIPYTTGSNGPSSGTFSAKLDGSLFTASSIIATLENGLSSTVPKRLRIIGMGDNKSMALDFDDNASSFTFPISGIEASILYTPLITSPSGVFSSINPFNPSAVVGNITISSHDVVANKISGTFQIKLFKMDLTGAIVGSMDVTEGVFNNVTYIDNTD
ncbi:MULTISPECIES: DUF6252 family protein [Flavobacterium]|uniref:Lipoprotein n=1 Tax=Flavobacterium aurantiibacter TaxID=2023067 RepID=A0A255ZZD0_9FLAO|nr:DUF6252 family protein [Flavobacterium aurantiibacter]OYQ46848.1 hypothetical protein CHX27_03870 [Flavobacterium aurantiibacter]